MKILLDTHALLWWFVDPDQLSKKATALISDEKVIAFVSPLSVWEIEIKRLLGKLKSPDNIEALILEEGFTELPVSVAHARAIRDIPALHSDPFDRLLLAQAKVEKAVLISRDKMFKQYGLPLVEA